MLFSLGLFGYLTFLLSCDIDGLAQGYRITIVLPVVFLFCFCFLLWDPLFRIKTPYLVLFPVIACIRYVFLSLSILTKSTYLGLSGVPPTPDSLTFAGVLLAWELVITSLVINRGAARLGTVQLVGRNELRVTGEPVIYVTFVLFVSALLIMFPQARKGLSFFTSFSLFESGETSLLTLFLRQCFANAKYFLFFTAVALLQRKGHRKHNRPVSYLIVSLCALIVIGLRIGTNRKQILADCLAVFLSLMHLFPEYRRRSLLGIGVVGASLFAATTIYRGMAPSSSGIVKLFTNLLTSQAYFLGQYNVAIAVEAKELFGYLLDYRSYILTYLRPIIGIGSFIKNIPFNMTTDLFHMRMSLGILPRHDQILPMIGEGYMLFGALLSPFFSIITAKLGLLSDRLYLTTTRLEVAFLSAVSSFYLAQGMILNFVIILNNLSFKLSISLAVIALAHLFRRTPLTPRDPRNNPSRLIRA